MRKIINTLLIVDIGIVIFTLLSGNRVWFINSQIGFISSSMVMFASIISYRNMVNSRVSKEVIAEDNRDTIEKIDDPYDIYDEKIQPIREVIEEEKLKLKKDRRSIWQMGRDAKPALSLYRLIAYAILILGFFYLNGHGILDIPSYLFALSTPPITVIVALSRDK